MGTTHSRIGRLREQAARDQYAAALHDYLTCEDAGRRARLVALLAGRAPTAADRERFAGLRAEWLHARDGDLTEGEVAQIAGVSAGELRGMAARGEMPAPCHRGRWHWWWGRGDLTAWLAQRSLE